MSLSNEEFPPQPAGNGELVHWMDGQRWRLGRAGVAPDVAGAFVLGIVAALGTVALLNYIVPRREALPPWRWRRGRLH